MISLLIEHFRLKEHSPIFSYIFPILQEHSVLLDQILSLGYIPVEAQIRENLREGNIYLNLDENTKFSETRDKLSGAEFVLQLYFSHPKSDSFSWPWSLVKLELSHQGLSGSF